MKRFSLLLYIIIFVTLKSNAQEGCQDYWTATYGSQNADPTIDEDGNIYVWDASFENNHVFAKYAQDGTLLFSKVYQIKNAYFKHAITVNDQHVYYAGSYHEITEDGVTIVSPELHDGILKKFDLEGNEIWSKTFVSGWLTAAVTDTDDNIIVAGVFTDSVIIDGVDYYAPGRWVGYFKLDGDGNVLWHKASRGSGRIFNIKIDENGYLVSSGAFHDESFTIGSITLTTQNPGWQSLINKFDANGNFLWQYTFGEGIHHNSYDLITNGSDVYFIGNFTESIEIEGNYHLAKGSVDGLVGKIDHAGNLQWYNIYGTDNSGSVEGWGGISVSTSGEILVITPVDLDDKENEIYVSIDGTKISEIDYNKSSYLLKYDAQGEFIEGRSLAFNHSSALRGTLIKNDIIYSGNYFSGKNIDNSVEPALINGTGFFTEPLDDSNSDRFHATLLNPESYKAVVGSSIELIAEGSDITSIQWYKDNDPIDGAVELTYEASESGQYSASSINSLACEVEVPRIITLEFFEVGLEQDSLALVEFYNYSQGTNWTNNDNWLIGPISSWHGVTVNNGRVVSLDLANNNIQNVSGSLSKLTELNEIVFSNNLLNYLSIGIESLPKLTTVMLDGNSLYAIPDLSSITTMDTYDVTGSIIQSYRSLESNAIIPNFAYSSHHFSSENCLVGVENETVTIGGNYYSGDYTSYTWSKDDVPIENDTYSLTIENFSPSDAGVYSLSVSNSLITEITTEISYSINATPYNGLILPTMGNWVATGSALFSGSTFASTNLVVQLTSLGNGEYRISDAAAGFYQLFGYSDEPAIIGQVCNDTKIINGEGIFGITSGGSATWDIGSLTLTVPWRDEFNDVDGISTFIYQSTFTEPSVQEITFDEIGDRLYGDVFDLSASSSSGLPVSYEIVDGADIAYLNGSELTISGYGYIEIKATQSGNENYLSAIDVHRSFIVQRGIPQITVTELFHQADNTEKSATINTNPSNLTKSIVYNGYKNSPINGGEYEVTVLAYNDFYYGTKEELMIINAQPEVINPIADIHIENGFDTKEIDLDQVFFDQDNETLIYTASSMNENIATATVTENILFITVVAVGETLISVTADDGRGGSTIHEFTINLAITGFEDTLLSAILVYPNPSQGMINIDGLDGSSQIQISDLQGKLIFNLKINPTQSNQIDLSNLNEGIYLMKINSKGINTTKVIFIK